MDQYLATDTALLIESAGEVTRMAEQKICHCLRRDATHTFALRAITPLVHDLLASVDLGLQPI